jgi:hypothetical protein
LKISSLVAIVAMSLVALSIPSSYAQLGNESITINTQKTAYGPGDTVNLTGLVNEGTPGQLVAIQVKDAKGNLILIRTVQADQNGFVITQSKSTTTPVPEFPASGFVLAASIASLIFYGIVSNRGPGIKLDGGK